MQSTTRHRENSLRCPVCGAEGFDWHPCQEGQPFWQGRCSQCGAQCWTVRGPDSQAYRPTHVVLQVT